MIFGLLAEALDRAGQNKQRGLELGRDFAKHAYAQVRATMDPEFVGSSEAYLRATDAYIDGEFTRGQLLEAVKAIPDVVRRGEGWGSVETPVLSPPSRISPSDSEPTPDPVIPRTA